MKAGEITKGRPLSQWLNIAFRLFFSVGICALVTHCTQIKKMVNAVGTTVNTLTVRPVNYALTTVSGSSMDDYYNNVGSTVGSVWGRIGLPKLLELAGITDEDVYFSFGEIVEAGGLEMFELDSLMGRDRFVCVQWVAVKTEEGDVRDGWLIHVDCKPDACAAMLRKQALTNAALPHRKEKHVFPVTIGKKSGMMRGLCCPQDSKEHYILPQKTFRKKQ